MARITVEDCLEKVSNRFELVRVATKRARQLATTAVEPLVPAENDKPTVIALREIAAGFISEENVAQITRPIMEYKRVSEEDLTLAAYQANLAELDNEIVVPDAPTADDSEES